VVVVWWLAATAVGKNYSTKTYTSCELVSSFLIVDFCKILLETLDVNNKTEQEGKKERRNKKGAVVVVSFSILFFALCRTCTSFIRFPQTSYFLFCFHHLAP
jgi:hypothetical protein